MLASAPDTIPANNITPQIVAGFALLLIFLRCAAELILDRINAQHVRRHADAVPSALQGIVDEPTYRKSVAYTLAKLRFGGVRLLYDTGILSVILFSGWLAKAFEAWTEAFGQSAASCSGFLLAAAAALSIPDLPFSWYAQFRLEERFGFNTSTMRTWMVDRVKGAVLGLIIAYPLLWLVLKIVAWAGGIWWLWAWAAILSFQLLLMLLAPALIMPLFNKFTPLPEGSLRSRLFSLASRTGFPTRSIEVMDGSKRSRHSNAFFTGLGKLRKIVLFDTLVAQLSETELEAVLAHEIGHYKKKHILKMIAASAVSLLIGLFLVAMLARQTWFYEAFQFDTHPQPSPVGITPCLLIFSLLSGAITFWLSPLINAWSRRYEYEADRFAAETVDGPDSLIGALRKLSEKNLSNLTPHPLYSGFHYSHPTLGEREQALRGE